jgi:hypothetical protein
MSIASRLPIVAVLVSLVVAPVAACTSPQQADSSVQLPGEPSRRTGLEVPPDAWAHPATQTANVSPQR